jgi:hypothetical protein
MWQTVPLDEWTRVNRTVHVALIWISLNPGEAHHGKTEEQKANASSMLPSLNSRNIPPTANEVAAPWIGKAVCSISQTPSQIKYSRLIAENKLACLTRRIYSQYTFSLALNSHATAVTSESTHSTQATISPTIQDSLPQAEFDHAMRIWLA